MSIFAIGINHKTATVAVRERIYFSQDRLPLYLQDLLTQGFAQEAVLLSTCNRSELYCEAADVSIVCDWFCAQTSLSRQALEPSLYIYHDAEAIAHILNVACGLDSMILGEPQILGQMKEAFSESCTAGAVSTLFHRLFQQVFTVAKEIRTATAIGACPVSVASAALHFAKQRYEQFNQANVMIIGAGDTAELLMRYLKTYAPKSVSVVNRDLEKALGLTQTWGGRAYRLDQMTNALAHADIVFSATGSAVPVVNAPLIETVLAAHPEKHLTFIDIAVPRDIDAEVAHLPGVSLYCIDDLKAIIERNRKGREHAADKARDMIFEKSQAFMAEMKSHDKISHTIRAYRGQIEMICQAELSKAKQQLVQGIDPDLVLESFACAFTKKLLHSPSIQLRQAGKDGRFDLLSFAKQLFAITERCEDYEAIDTN